ncbi:MAG TPA: hypothetical protein PKJ33_01125 [Alphaproteobacteria bacterium]|nr:hypothetical protein [Alphaproteobacteria bacterium]
MNKDIIKFIEKLSKCWSAETSLYNDKREPKSTGQCSVSALCIQDKFGGEIRKIKVNGVSHFFNFIDGEIIDSTKDQFTETVNYENSIFIKRNFHDKETIERYKILKNKVENLT